MTTPKPLHQRLQDASNAALFILRADGTNIAKITRDELRAVTKEAVASLRAADAAVVRCGCPQNEPEADPESWPCPCGAHCRECSGEVTP